MIDWNQITLGAAWLIIFGPIIVASLFLIRDGYRLIKEQI